MDGEPGEHRPIDFARAVFRQSMATRAAPSRHRDRAAVGGRRLPRGVTALAAAASLIVVASLTSCAQHDAAGAPAAGGEVVPFLDTTFEPDFGLPSYDAAPESMPECVLSKKGLSLTSVTAPPPTPREPVTNTSYTIVFSNLGSSCALGTPPTITLTSPSGEGAPMVAELPAPDESLLPARWVAKAGTEVTTSVTFAGEPCSRFPDTTWDLLLQQKGSAPLRTSIDAPKCGAPDSGGDIIRSGLWEPRGTLPQSTRLPTAPTDALTVTIDSPTEIPFGTPINYTVTLTNPTTEPISLSPCPKYRQAAGESGTVSEYYGVLNCAKAPKTVNPDQSVTFQMTLDAPPEFSAGEGAACDGTSTTATTAPPRSPSPSADNHNRDGGLPVGHAGRVVHAGDLRPRWAGTQTPARWPPTFGRDPLPPMHLALAQPRAVPRWWLHLTTSCPTLPTSC